VNPEQQQRLVAVHEQMRALVLRLSRCPRREGIDLEEAAAATVEYFAEDEGSTANPVTVFWIRLRRERRRRLRDGVCLKGERSRRFRGCGSRGAHGIKE
jgi:hypothetical protein